ncbi:TPA: metal-dependent hydrolase [Candidatus Nomurabacteria bacterium]|nr:metal-dependent hydrolase [Candidatus Nomurabacteria bacterium]
MNIVYKQSIKAKQLRISIKSDLSIVVTYPSRVNIAIAEKFVNEKRAWIENSLNKMKIRVEKRGISTLPKSSKKGLVENKEEALKLVNKKLLFWNNYYNLTWKNVSIKNTKTRWGSCSKKGNFNFNYRIIFLPEILADYLIVHELCHLKEMNHSSKFWELVEQTIPDYKKLRRELKNI